MRLQQNYSPYKHWEPFNNLRFIIKHKSEQNFCTSVRRWLFSKTEKRDL